MGARRGRVLGKPCSARSRALAWRARPPNVAISFSFSGERLRARFWPPLLEPATLITEAALRRSRFLLPLLFRMRAASLMSARLIPSATSSPIASSFVATTSAAEPARIAGVTSTVGRNAAFFDFAVVWRVVFCDVGLKDFGVAEAVFEDAAWRVLVEECDFVAALLGAAAFVCAPPAPGVCGFAWRVLFLVVLSIFIGASMPSRARRNNESPCKSSTRCRVQNAHGGRISQTFDKSRGPSKVSHHGILSWLSKRSIEKAAES